MITPKYINKGDKIAIVATARKISEKKIQPAVKKFHEWGLEVVLGKHLFEEYNQFAGTDEQRTYDLQQMLDDETVKAIIIARGGYGTVRIIDKLNFSNFIKKPKWIAGYSDVTVLHSHIHSNFGIETLHSTMPLNFPEKGINNQALNTLKKALFGEDLIYTIKASSLNRNGIAEGIFIGGNLSILYSLSGSKSDIHTKGKILFIEDLDEYLYHIDRMMVNLKRSGKLENLAGLIVGSMSEMNDNTIPFGKTANEIIAETVKEFDYPVCFNFPAGHIKNNSALIFGRNAKLQVYDEVQLSFTT